MRTPRIQRLVVAAVLVFAARVAWADHCPEDRTASAAPETSLAGVDVIRDKVPDVLARLGKPTSHKEGREADYPVGSGWADYEWKYSRATVSMSTEFYTSDTGARVEAVELIQMSGTSSRAPLCTGKGLRLGDEVKRVLALYGTTYVEGTVNGPELGKRTMTYCFSDETELSIGLTADSHVVAMWLHAPVE